MPDDVPLHFRYLDNFIPIPLNPPEDSTPAALWPASNNEAPLLTAALAAVNSHCDLVTTKVQERLNALQSRFSCFIQASEQKYDALAASHADACATLRTFEEERRAQRDRVFVDASVSVSSSAAIAHIDAAVGTSSDPLDVNRSHASIQTGDAAAAPPDPSCTSIYSLTVDVSEPLRGPVVLEQLEEENKTLRLEVARLGNELEQYNNAFGNYILAAVATPPVSTSTTVDPNMLSGDVPPPTSPDDSPEVATLKAELEKKDKEIKQLDQRCNRYMKKSVDTNRKFVALKAACVCKAAATLKPARKEHAETTTQEPDSSNATPCPPKATARKRATGRKNQAQTAQSSQPMPVAGPSSVSAPARISHDSQPQTAPPPPPCTLLEPVPAPSTIPHAGPSSAAARPDVPRPRGIKKPQQYTQPGRSTSSSSSSSSSDSDGEDDNSSDSDVILVEGLGKGTGRVRRHHGHDASDMHAPEEWEMGEDDDDDDGSVFASASASAPRPGQGKRKKVKADINAVKRKRAKTLHGPPMTPTPVARARTPMPSTQMRPMKRARKSLGATPSGASAKSGRGTKTPANQGTKRTPASAPAKAPASGSSASVSSGLTIRLPPISTMRS
ncbi:hypothetical protein DENSPDRAFT_838669 [Dentipellis sp. KUC8613]|nr:hypothetical protein DENSPDRAFT_838669 [Dentipellis sp. KUC8613]